MFNWPLSIFVCEGLMDHHSDVLNELMKSFLKHGFRILVLSFIFLQGAAVKVLQMARTSRSKFIIHISAKGLECFGVDTQVSLVATKRQIAFREVSDQRLKRILLVDDAASIVDVKMVLGKGHLDRKEFSRDNAHISSRFLMCFWTWTPRRRRPRR